MPFIASSVYCFNTQPPEGGWQNRKITVDDINVSTHSRPKAAGDGYYWPSKLIDGFNTQPPEGGWHKEHNMAKFHKGFNTQPPEGGW